ncbi:hypothetical protein chiPu_0023992 [Chiloscyllium punctatum]|uniref:Uncharacterized protein n=1 Tax=Chiloscyllium punctatum TaxID=137246 RepID=A0A401TCG6_CHIPU|nr:hypothetical protein [Chiloscyllium punctatum]
MPSSNITTYLPWSIINLLCCCLPLGIAAVIFSCQAQNANELGNVDQARSASSTAKKLNIAGTVIGVILIILVVVVYFTTNARK